MANPTPTEIVVEEFRVQLARKRLTVKDLAALIGEDYQGLNRRFNGAPKFTLDELYAVAVALDLDLSLLMPRTVAA